MKISITVSLEEKVVERIDHARGLASRSAFVQDMLGKQLKEIEA